MYAINDIGYLILITFIFTIMHFLFERMMLTKWISKFNINKINLEIIAGVYYSIISLGCQLIIWSINENFNIPICVFTSLLLISNRNWISSLINLFPTIFFIILNFKINLLTYNIIGSAIIIIFIFEIIKLFFNTKIYVFIIFGISIFIFNFSYLIYGLLENFNLEDNIIEYTLLGPIFVIISCGIYWYLLQFSISANILSESVTYVFSTYYRHPVSRTIIQNEIINKNIKYGIWVLFKIDFEKTNDPLKNIDIERKVLNIIKNKVPNSTILFNVENNINGFFIPRAIFKNIKNSINGNNLKNREENDDLKIVENIFIETKNNFKKIDNLKIEFNVGISIYGLQENSLENLEILAFKAMTKKSNNFIKIFDYEKYREEINNNKLITEMDNFLRLDNYELKFFPIFSNKKNDLILANVDNISEYKLQVNAREFVKFNYWVKEFDRFFAIDILNKFKSFGDQKYKILFDYSPIYFDQKINFLEIKEKIKRMGINHKDICFIIDKISKNKIFDENILQIKKNGFLICTKNIGKNEIPKNIEFDFHILTPNFFNEKMIYNLKRTIFANIVNLEQFKLAKKYSGNMFAGKFLQETTDIKNITKNTNDNFLFLLNKN